MTDVLISIDSSSLGPNTDPAEFEVRFNNSILLESLAYNVSLVKLNTWYSSPNISNFYENRVIDIDDGSGYDTITVPEGIYSFEDWNTYFQEQMEAEYGALTPQHVEFSVNRNTGKFTMEVQSGITIDIAHGLAGMFGFVDMLDPNFDKTATYSVTGPISVESDYIPQWSNNVQSWALSCDLTDASTLNGKNGNIICHFSPRSVPYSSIEYEPKNLVYQQVNKTNIKSIKFKIVDQQGRKINLQDHVSILLVIRPFNFN